MERAVLLGDDSDRLLSELGPVRTGRTGVFVDAARLPGPVLADGLSLDSEEAWFERKRKVERMGLDKARAPRAAKEVDALASQKHKSYIVVFFHGAVFSLMLVNGVGQIAQDLATLHTFQEPRYKKKFDIAGPI